MIEDVVTTYIRTSVPAVGNAQRERILADAFHSGARVCDVARRQNVALACY